MMMLGFFSVGYRFYLWYPVYLLTATVRLNKQKPQRNVLIFALCLSLLKTLYTDTVFYFLKQSFYCLTQERHSNFLSGKSVFYGVFYNTISEARFKNYFFIKCAMCFEYKTEIVTFENPMLHMQNTVCTDLINYFSMTWRKTSVYSFIQSFCLQ